MKTAIVQAFRLNIHAHRHHQQVRVVNSPSLAVVQSYKAHSPKVFPIKYERVIAKIYCDNPVVNIHLHTVFLLNFGTHHLTCLEIAC
jgi:hypothetical protein